MTQRADVGVNRKMMEVCGEAENRLASELMHHELQIEKDVLDPLSQLAEVRELHLNVHLVNWPNLHTEEMIQSILI